jgi:hypothetical protein
MKRLILVVALLLSSFATFAQDQHLPTRSVFVELGGSGLAYSFNYDFRFDSTRMDSWGMRVGAGGYKIGGDSFFSLPVLVNKLYGKDGRYFELGLGMTFFGVDNEPYSYYSSCQYFDSNGNCVGPLVTQESDINFILPVDGSPSLMGTMNIGYRKIPVDGGFTWRVNLTPIFNNNGFWPLFAGVGFGYAF